MYKQQPFENIKLYKDGLTLVRDVNIFVSKMIKEHRYSIGGDLRNSSLSLTKEIMLTSMEKEVVKKLERIEKIKEYFAEILCLYRIIFSLSLFSQKEYEVQIDFLEVIYKQIKGWEGSLQK